MKRRRLLSLIGGAIFATAAELSLARDLVVEPVKVKRFEDWYRYGSDHVEKRIGTEPDLSFYMTKYHEVHLNSLSDAGLDAHEIDRICRPRIKYFRVTTEFVGNKSYCNFWCYLDKNVSLINT